LIEEVFPTVYGDLITQLISQQVDHERVTSALPTEDQTRANWEPLLGPLYQTHLINDSIFWTAASSGKWDTISNVNFLQEDLDGQDDSDELRAVRNMLTHGNVQVVHYSASFVRTIRAHFGREIQTLNPGRVRAVLRRYGNLLTSQNRETKLHILSYLMSDSCYSDLHGIQLLPLDNGSFVEFDAARQKVFVENRDHPKSLLMPGFEGRFVSPDLPYGIVNHFASALNGKQRLFKRCIKPLITPISS